MRLIRLLKRDLCHEVKAWMDEGLVTHEQATAICQRYDIDPDQFDTRSAGYHLLVGLGFIFIGLALIVLIGANWSEIPRAIRMFGLIFSTLLIQGVGLTTFRKGHLKKATSFFLLGNIFYGASIILIAQIYHLGEHMPDGVFWWALGSLPIAILINSSWLTLFSLLLGILWLLLESQMGFYPTLFPIFLLSALAVLWRGKQNSMLFLTTVGATGLWLEYTLAQLWKDHSHFNLYPEHLAVTVSLFIFLYAVSHYWSGKDNHKLKDYGALLSIWCIRFGLIIMFVMSFRSPWEFLITAEWNHLLSMGGIVLFLLGGSIALSRESARYTPSENETWWRTPQLQPLFGWIGLFGFSLVFLILTENTDHALYLQILFNTALIGMGIRLILKGIHDGVSHYFFLGITIILITAFTRYINLIENYIGGALLFMLFSALLLGSAHYWKKNHGREVADENK